MKPIPYDSSWQALRQPGLMPAVWEADASPELIMAEASRLAYRPFERHDACRASLTDDFCRVGFHALHFFHVPRTDTQAIGAWRASDGVALLAIRGTQIGVWRDAWTEIGRAHV